MAYVRGLGRIAVAFLPGNIEATLSLFYLDNTGKNKDGAGA